MDKFIKLCSDETIGPEERRRHVQSLLKNGQLDPKRNCKSRWYPIHYAARYGHSDLIEVLVSSFYCDPHLPTSRDRYTALHIAVEHNHLEVVEALLQQCPNGTPAKRDKDGNTPLHLACKKGSLEMVNRLTSKYFSDSIHDANKAGVTPLGFAVQERETSIAKFLMKQSLGNPDKKFCDFRAKFPSFKYKQSLDHPVSIFVMGNRQTGKSTLIKSLQVEGYINRAFGVFARTSGVGHHSGGIVPSDVSSYGYGRAKFYELSSGRQTTQENIFLSPEKSAHAIFIITISFKDEMKEMAANLLYWLSFIYHQYRSVAAGIMPSVAVVGSFLFYTQLGSLRLQNHHRLHLVYHRVLNTHTELCSHFRFLGKYSLDCRLSESLGLRQLRSVLRRKSRELRPTGGEANLPSSCFVLLSALHELRAAPSDLPVLRLSDIECQIAEISPLAPLSLLSFLPSHAEDLQPLLAILEERKAVVVLDHLDHRDPWIIFDEFKLISQIDGTLIQKVLRMSQSSYFNPGVMDVKKLLECLSPLSNTLSKDVLLNVLHRFKITEVMARGNDTKYFLPSVLKISQPSMTPPVSWKPNDQTYSLGFAQCILPHPNQTIPFFMPRFLYFMLYELFASTVGGDFDFSVMTYSSLHCQLNAELQIFVTIDSSAIILNVRCSPEGAFSCLQIRNEFASIIHRQRELFQPNLKVTEFIVPMEGLHFPIAKFKQINEHGIPVSDLKTALKTKSSSKVTESISKLRSFEPYEWLSKLKKDHLHNLLDPLLTNVEVTKEFVRDLANCVGENWTKLLEYSELLQGFDTSTSAEEPDLEETIGNDAKSPPQQLHYGQLLDLFSSMSIFQKNLELTNALKDQNKEPTQNDPSSGNNNKSERRTPLAVPEDFPPVHQLPSSTSSNGSVYPLSIIDYEGNNSGQQLNQLYQQDSSTLKTCSTCSESSSLASMHFSVPNLQAGKAVITMNDIQNVQFITTPEVLKCVATGGKFQHKIHGISFTIPPQAVREGTEITIEYAIAVVGPFTFPEGITPVSPILWVRIFRESYGAGRLQKPLEIGLPHAVICRENSTLLHFLCAQSNRESYSFAKTHKSARFKPCRGTLNTKLSKQQYFFCIAAKVCQEVISKTQYCIIKVAPKHPYDCSWKMYFFVTYALAACVEMVRQQFGMEYFVEDRCFQFDTSWRDPSITLEYERMTAQQWTLTKEGTYRQIEASRVEFGNLSSFEMNTMNRYHMYPPNFTITINGHQATGNSIANFEFKGVAQSELFYEIPLMVPRRRTTNSVSSTFEQDISLNMQENHREPPTTHDPRPPSQSSVHSAPVVGNTATRHRLGGVSGSTIPRTSGEQLRLERASAMTALQNNFNTIRKQLDNSAIRGELYQLHALTDDECQSLLNSATMSDANERLIFIISKGGVNGFKQFMIALQKTSDEYPGHRDILEDLKRDLQLAQHYSHSAAYILSALPPSSGSCSQSVNNVPI